MLVEHAAHPSALVGRGDEQGNEVSLWGWCSLANLGGNPPNDLLTRHGDEMISLPIGRMVNGDGVKGLVRKRPEVAQRVLPQRVHTQRITLWFIRSNLEHTLPLVLAASFPSCCGSHQPTLFRACWQGCFCAPETAQPKH